MSKEEARVELLKVIEEIGEQTKYKQDKNTKLYLESLHNTLLNIYVWL